MTGDLKVVARIEIEGVVTDGLDTVEALEGAVLNLATWLAESGAQSGDELVLVRK